jgi:hypothetical protein
MDGQTTDFSKLRHDLAAFTTYVTMVVVFFAGWYWVQSDPVPLGGLEMTRALVALGFALGFAVSIAGYRRFSLQQRFISEAEQALKTHIRKNWIGWLAVSFAVAVIAAILCTVAANLVGKMFIGVQISRLGMILLLTSGCGGLGYVAAYFVLGIDDSELVLLLLALGFIGLTFSFLVVTDERWWKYSLSYLGTDENAGDIFNGSVIIVGLVALTLAYDLNRLFQLLPLTDPLRTFGGRLLRNGLLSIGICITSIGLFPIAKQGFDAATDVEKVRYVLHDASGWLMAILFVSGALLLRWLARGVYSRPFLVASVDLGGICLLAVIGCYLFHSINFVALEILLFSTFGVWIYCFRYHTVQYVYSHLKQSVPT